MSSVKYDDVACDNVATNLDSITSLLEDVNSELQKLLNALPSSDRIDNRIIKLSTKTRVNDDGISEEYIDYDTVSYYENNYKVPLLAAQANLAATSINITSLNTGVVTIDEKVKGVQNLVKDYEETPVEEREITGLTGGAGVGAEEVAPPTTISEDEGEGIARTNVDTDGDGKPDLNVDIDGDGKADLNVDTDGDGKPDVNIDTDGDGKADLNVDTDNDGKPDLNVDTDGDGKADLNIDTNGDGKPDLNVDIDGDGKADLNIDTNGDGKPDVNIDIDGDGKADLNVDTDNDGKPNINIDTDGDGKPDYNVDTDGDGKADSNDDANSDEAVDPITTSNNEDTEPEDGDGNSESEASPSTPGSDLFDEEDADKSDDGFADNIVAGMTPSSDGSGNESGGSSENGGAVGVGNNSASGEGTENSQLFPFLPGNSANAEGDNSDLIYRGLYEQNDESFDMNQIKYDAIGENGSAVAKGAAVVGAVGLGLSGVDAVATLNENRKQDADTMLTSEEKEEKRLVKTVISSSILGLVSVGYIIALIVSEAPLLATLLLGIAMAISSITAASSLKIGKYIGFGAVLFVSLLTFILSSLGVISPIGYVVVFAVFVVLSIAAVLLDLLKGMFDDKIELLPIVIAIAVGLFFGMLKVLNIINWIILIVLLLLVIGGYFLWDKVIKYKLPDDDEDEVVDNVIYKPAQYTENSPINAIEEAKFDPRDLFQEDDVQNQEALNNMMNQQNQNPFNNYNPNNTTFDNAFKDDNNNNNNGMF